MLQAAPEPQSRKVVFLLSQSNSMPMLELQRDRPTDGILKDMASELAAQLQRDVQFRVLPRKRLQAEIESGAADLYCYTNAGWLKGDMLWSEPLIRNHDVIVTRRDTVQPKAIQALKNQRVGTVLGYQYPELEKLLGPQFIRDDGLSEQQNLKKLLARRYDYLIMSELDFLYLFRQRELNKQLNQTTLRISSYDNACALSRHSTIKLAQLNAAIQRLKKNNRIQAIQLRYR